MYFHRRLKIIARDSTTSCWRTATMLISVFRTDIKKRPSPTTQFGRLPWVWVYRRHFLSSLKLRVISASISLFYYIFQFNFFVWILLVVWVALSFGICTNVYIPRMKSLPGWVLSENPILNLFFL
jgi:hypothetical protein